MHLFNPHCFQFKRNCPNIKRLFNLFSTNNATRTNRKLKYLANDLIARKGYNFKRGDIDFYYSQNVTDLLPQRKTTRNTTPTQTVVLLMCFM